MDFNKLSLEEKFGQMFMLGLDTYEINDEIIEIIKKYKIGGVILFKKNYTSLETMNSFINKLKKVNSDNKIPLFIAIYQENGRVNRFPKDIIKMYSAKKQGDTNNIKIIEYINEITAYLLKSVGVNMNFAPTLDIYRDKNKTIGNRNYANTYEGVIKYGIPFMKTLQRNKIISVIKHFPSISLSEKDYMVRIPKIKNIEELKNKDMKVFENAIFNGSDAIMLGRVKIKGYGNKEIMQNKSSVNDLLKKNLKYKGLIVTDDFRMKSGIISNVYKKTKNCIDASCDILTIKYKKNDIKVFEKLFKKMKNFEYDIEKINNSAYKIFKIKEKYGISDETFKLNVDINKINEKIKMINDKIEKEALN